MKPTPDPLDDLLSEWQVSGEASPSFQREVWARIASAEAEPTWSELLVRFFLRPRGWAMASAAALLLGSGLAWFETRPSRLNPHDAYVRSISPFASLHVAAH